MKKEKTLINISKKGFFSVVAILAVLIVAAGILTFVIPQGSYQYDADGIVIPGTYAEVLEGEPLPVWKWVLAPILVLGTSDGLSIIVISLFLLILGGTFSLMDKTGGIKAILNRLIRRFKEKKYTLLRLIVLVFMVFGAFFGIFEESVALLPILILLSLSLGWDTMTGLGMTVLAAGFGFASGITNPFTVGIASELAGVNLLSGVWYRLLIFAAMYALLSTFLVRYAKKVEADPTKSLTFEADRGRIADLEGGENLPVKNETAAFRSYSLMFLIVLFFIFALSISELAFGWSISTIPFIALTFLAGGWISGWIVTRDFRYVLKQFAKGALSVAPAVLLIMMAASVKYVIVEGGVMDTILHYLSDLLSGVSPMVGILLIFLLVLILEFFIGSASAKAYLVIPLLVPLVSLVGFTKEIAILAFLFGDGFANVIFPTNGVLLIGLSIVGISYGKWFRWTILLQALTMVLTVLFLLVGLWIGY
jgi:uncharacterized ion transporter superfamily protein YfcC